MARAIQHIKTAAWDGSMKPLGLSLDVDDAISVARHDDRGASNRPIAR